MLNNLKGDSITKNVKLFIIFILLVFLMLIYVYRLFTMQIIQGEQYRTQSRTISSQVSSLPAQRGEIFDRNANLPMVINTESFAVEITPGEIPSEKYDTVTAKLAGFMGISKNTEKYTAFIFYSTDKIKRSI